ncbi:MAG: dihydrofolate reductase [Oscillospiraceae bacterium]|nr:dihydrofolate reductase [Oscillospiraceae bacterium]
MRLIASVDESWALGQGGGLLYHTQADVRHLRELTMGHVLLMGGKTFRSLPNGALPGRVNIVLSRGEYHAVATPAHVAHTVDEALSALEQYPDKEHFIFGGGEIYRLLLPYCNHADITRYAHTRRADTFLPRLDGLPNWAKMSQSLWHEEDSLRFCFEVWENANPLRIAGKRGII